MSLAAAVSAVAALHRPFSYQFGYRAGEEFCEECNQAAETEASVEWPCPTILALYENAPIKYVPYEFQPNKS